jgi:hypothetical protein
MALGYSPVSSTPASKAFGSTVAAALPDVSAGWVLTSCVVKSVTCVVLSSLGLSDLKDTLESKVTSLSGLMLVVSVS